MSCQPLDRVKLKNLFHKDNPENVRDKPLLKADQEVFFQAFWDLGRYNNGLDVIEEPRPLRDAKIRAIQSLNLSDDDSIIWDTIRQSYKIIAVWESRGRGAHSGWLYEITVRKLGEK